MRLEDEGPRSSHPQRVLGWAAGAPGDGEALGVFHLIGQATERLGQSEFCGALFDLLKFSSGYDYIFLAAFTGDSAPRPLYSNLSGPEAEAIINPYVCDLGYYRDDPMAVLSRACDGDGVFRLCEHVDGDFASTPYYRDYYRNTLLTDETCVSVRLGGEDSLMISLGARARKAPGEARVRRLRALAPTISALCRQNWGGRQPVPAPAAPRLPAPAEGRRLSGREGQIYDLVMEGRTNKEIARQLDLSPETVKIYRRRMLKKMEASSSRELFSRAISLNGAKPQLA